MLKFSCVSSPPLNFKYIAVTLETVDRICECFYILECGNFVGFAYATAAFFQVFPHRKFYF